MKRMLTCLLTLTALLALTAPAFADVLWTPENSFFEKHYDECEPLVRGYYANGPDGFVTLWDAPGGSIVQGQYENGTALWVYWLYKDWGCIGIWEAGKETDGWVPMDQLSLIYDYLCFEEEYANFITDYTGEFADYDGDAKAVNFYEYPGAPEAKQALSTDSFDGLLDNLTGRSGNSYISKIFVDEDGRTWGYVGYVYGIRNAWFCLDDPDGTDFPVREVSTADLTPARTPVLPAKGYLPYVLVGAVVVVTAGVLLVLVKKKKNG